MSELPRERRTKKQAKEDPIVTVAKALAPQMGSDPRHLSQQQIDQRKFAVLNEYTQAAIGYFAWRGRKMDRGERKSFFSKMVDWELNTSPSLGGLGRRQVIQTIAAAAGVGKNVLEVAERPNILARNLTRRDWKKKAMEDGKVVQE